MAVLVYRHNALMSVLAEKVSLGKHAGRFKAPTVDEVAVIMAGDPVDNRAIKIARWDSTVSTISDLHFSYDALQYPPIFWLGQEEYHLSFKQSDPSTGLTHTDEKVAIVSQLLEAALSTESTTCQPLISGLSKPVLSSLDHITNNHIQV
ncbi:helitron_like_N domain-containing protein [Nephila pilipes]|uniref:Helitron_like_N domain-containing protein n=1 Tax=Nephila pilipes TaxID=299642 RepID=A0A8X6KGL8_NEPPI|nr:helitron_like_N domain-containing protein [Nephila pilipes]